MRSIERVLLYAVAIVLGGLLLSDGGQIRAKGGVEAGSSLTTPAEGHADDQHSTALLEDSGLSRIETRLRRDGTAELLLNDRFGEPLIRLAAGAKDTGEIRIAHGSRSAVMALQPDGGLKVSLNSAPETGMVLEAAAGGDVFLRLNSVDGASGQMIVLRNGATEVSLSSRKGGVETLMRTDVAGGAELAIHDAARKHSTSLAMLPDGETGLSIRGSGRDSQLSLKLFEDGLGEIAIRGPEGEGGPHMLRMADGTAAVSARRSDGTPGASLICTPNHAAALTMAHRDGKPRAILRLNKDGQPELAVPDSAAEQKSSDEAPPGTKRPGSRKLLRRPAKPGIGILGISESN